MNDSLAVDDNARKRLRRQMRAARRSLTPGERHRASRRLARNLRGHRWLQHSRRIGVYRAHMGELDVLAGLDHPMFRKRDLFLPVLEPLNGGLLRFVHWHPQTTVLTRNRFGIDEPSLLHHRPEPVWTLDLLLMPLVAFDRHGNRLGMGGGFYDRTLASLAHQPRRPRLVGVAYRFQECDTLPVAPWDWPLDDVITD